MTNGHARALRPIFVRVAMACASWLLIGDVLLAQRSLLRPESNRLSSPKPAATQNAPNRSTTSGGLDQRNLQQQIAVDRQAAQSLNRLKQFLTDHNFSAAAKLYREAFVGTAGDEDPAALRADSILWSADGRLLSVRTEARNAIEQGGTEAVQVFEELFGAEANAAFTEAVKDQDSVALSEVARQHFFTSAGFRALERLGSWQFDSGQFDSAAAVWIDLLSSPAHARRVTLPFVRKAALAMKLAERYSELDELLQGATSQFALGTKDRDALLKLKSEKTPPRIANGRDWMTPFGDAENNRQISGTAPYLKPRWSRSLITSQQAGEDAFYAEQIASFEQEAATAEFAPVGAAHLPIVMAGQLVVRDSHGLTGMELESGRTLWRYVAPASAGAALWSLQSRFQLMEHSFDLAHVGNATIGMPSSLGDRIFSVEVLGYEQPETDRERRVRFAPPDRRRGLTAFPCDIVNRLVCVRLPHRSADNGQESRVTPEWVVATRELDDDNPLAGCTFLSPPLPSNGAVFVLGETDRTISLLKFDARTGQLLMMQPLCIVEASILSPTETFRLPTSNLLAFANGLIICPTETGLLMAVDPLFGEIRWVQSYANPQRNNVDRNHRDQLGWPDPPHVSGNNIYHLPRLSDDLLSLNAQTGERQWQVSRNEAKYIATVTAYELIVVGERWVRGISRDNGKTLWSSDVGVVSGRAAVLHDAIVVPLKNGTVTTVDIKTGQTRGISATALTRLPSAEPQAISRARADAWRHYGRSPEDFLSVHPVGNLIALREHVISVGLRDVTVFAQAGTLRDELAAKPRRTPDEELTEIGAQLALGGIDDVSSRLNQLLNSNEPATRELARSASRDIEQHRFFELMAANRGNEARDSASRLLTLSQSPEEQLEARAQLLIVEERNRNWSQVTQAARKLHELPSDDLVPVAPRSEHAVAPRSLAQRAFARSLRRVPSQEREVLMSQMRPDFSAAVRSGSMPDLERFLDLYGELPEAASVRLQLADRLIRAERFHEAEHWLRITLRTGQRAERAAAQLMRVALLATAELPGEAARTLQSLQTEFADVELQDVLKRDYDALKPFFDLSSLQRKGEAITAQQIGAAIRPGTELARIAADLQPLDWNVTQVRVVNRGVTEARTLLADLFAGQRRLETGSHQDVDIQPSSSDGGQRWAFIDRTSGTERGAVKLSSSVDVDFNEVRRGRSHLIPLGTTGGALAVSLLTPRISEPLWELSFPLGNGETEDVEVTTISASVCLLRTANHLVAVNAANGGLLWRRSDLTIAHGIFSDLSAYLFGDDDIIVAFQRDGRNYVMLDTRTGETLRTGQQLVDRQGNLVIGMGRRLLYVTRGLDGHQPMTLQIWDPLLDRVELQVPFNPVTFPPVVLRDNHVALFQVENDSAKTGRFLLLSPEQGQPVLDITLPLPAEVRRMDAPHAFIDGDYVFINLRRNDQSPRAGERLVQIMDSMIPTESLHNGDLIAVRRSTGKILWHRVCRTQAALRLNRCNLPFLVTAVLVQPSGGTDTQSLAIQVIDKASGVSLTLDRESRERESSRLIGSGQHFIPQRFAHYEFDRTAGRLSLYGLTRRNADFSADTQRTLGMVGRIDLEFSPGLQRFLLETSP